MARAVLLFILLRICMIWLGDSRPAALKSENDTKDNQAFTKGEREASDYIEDSSSLFPTKREASLLGLFPPFICRQPGQICG